MAVREAPAPATKDGVQDRRRQAGLLPARARRDWTPQVVALLLLNAVILRPLLADALDVPALQTWATLFVAVAVQALPFLALGVMVSGAVAAFVRPGVIARALPRSPLAAVPIAGLAGAALPGCECGSVPVAGRLAAAGAAPAAALTFMLSAPAINPVVLVATAVAFPGRPAVVAARFAASLAAAVLTGWVWQRIGGGVPLRLPRSRTEGGSRWETLVGTARHDLLHAGGWLVVGAAAAASLQTVVPRSVLDAVAGNEVLAVTALAALAVVLAICSEADAFVAASLSQFSLTSRLVFMVVGPAVDVKLVALQCGTFGGRFAARFAPLAFVCAVGSALVSATVLL